jgi:hypothetical protein
MDCNMRVIRRIRQQLIIRLPIQRVAAAFIAISLRRLAVKPLALAESDDEDPV